MPGTVLTDLHRRGAADPGCLLSGPLRGVGLQWLDPGRSAELAADDVEHALYVTAGSGRAAAPDAAPDTAAPDDGIPLVEGTALALPLGTRTVLTAGSAGLEYFHAVLAVPHPADAPKEGEPR
ncbi:hypothetical protein [Kitasatospora aureofaciens]|uniref:hypothetical protein n=1 Tax=Kitasatospora aureofaciens TaxID=1894 RepID=UPI001C449CB7|nr:hypothetical protein [Kitasatospora aureofaciens]MBV6697266.1 hypothetical protein [Kitasatospora aureofaciens]